MTPCALRDRLAAATAALGLVGVTLGAGCGTSRSTRLQGDDAAGDPSEDDASTSFEASSFGGVFTSDASTGAGEALGAGCATATAQAKRQPAYLMFVVSCTFQLQSTGLGQIVPDARESTGR